MWFFVAVVVVVVAVLAAVVVLAVAPVAAVTVAAVAAAALGKKVRLVHSRASRWKLRSAVVKNKLVLILQFFKFAEFFSSFQGKICPVGNKSPSMEKVKIEARSKFFFCHGKLRF